MFRNVFIARGRRGNRKAWAQLMDAHYEAVARYIFLLDPELSIPETHELTERVFANALVSDARPPVHKSERIWLLELAASATRNRRRKTVQGESAAEARTARVPPNSPGKPMPETSLATTDGSRKAMFLRELLDRLAGPCRDLIELTYFGEAEHNEIAQAFEMAPHGIDIRVDKCLQRLEAFAGDEGLLEPTLGGVN